MEETRTPPHIAHLLKLLPKSRVRELAFFLGIGGFSAVCYVALNVVFTEFFGLRPSLSILATLAILIPPTYAAQRWLTFRSTRGHATAFPRYVATQMAGNGLGIAVAELCKDTVAGNPVAAFLAVAFFVATTNYAVLKYWTFRTQR